MCKIGEPHSFQSSNRSIVLPLVSFSYETIDLSLRPEVYFGPSSLHFKTFQEGLNDFASCQVLFASVLLPEAMLLAQTSQSNGNVTGQVSGPSGAAVPSATVTLHSESTQTTLTATTNAAGLYVFQNVNVGTYDLTVEKPGFRKSIVPQQLVSTG